MRLGRDEAASVGDERAPIFRRTNETVYGFKRYTCARGRGLARKWWCTMRRAATYLSPSLPLRCWKIRHVAATRWEWENTTSECLQQRIRTVRSKWDFSSAFLVAAHLRDVRSELSWSFDPWNVIVSFPTYIFDVRKIACLVVDAKREKERERERDVLLHNCILKLVLFTLPARRSGRQDATMRYTA